MKTKKVNRYYCDFCKHASCAAWATRRHERHCTMNPRRACRMCDHLQVLTTPMATLVAMLPDPQKYPVRTDEYSHDRLDQALTTDANKALEALREATEGCPACILAAIRQAGIPVYAVTEFDYAEERKAYWEVVNDAQRIAAN